MRAAKFLTTTALAAVLMGTAARADVTISQKPTENMSCQAGVCTPTAPNAVLNVGDLAGMLSSGDASVATGTVTNDIELHAALSWTSTSRLTLDAQRSVILKKPMAVTGTGALTITTNDGGKNGEFAVVPELGSVQFWDLASSLVIDRQNYTLVGDIKTLAADIAANPSGFYALAKSYDASADGTYSTSPITTPLSGALEGLGNQIASLSIKSSTAGDYVGFLDGIYPGGIVRNLEIASANILASEANAIGLLASGNAGQIMRCRTSGHISFPVTVAVGGLVGENDGQIVASTSKVRLSGTGSREFIGGLVGYNFGTIQSSFALRSMALQDSEQVDTGGLVGESEGLVENSFARNKIVDKRGNSNSNYGGLVGKNDQGAQIRRSYAAGEVKADSPATLGGLVGFDGAAPGSIANAYWDLDRGIGDPSQGAGNIPNDPGIKGLTTQQFLSGLPKGFDPKIWSIDPKINDGFPYLLAIPPK